MTPEEHTVTIYSARRAWALCACGWRSADWNSSAAAQYEWAKHVAERVKE